MTRHVSSDLLPRPDRGLERSGAAEQIGSKLVAQAQRMLVRDGSVIRPHGHCRAGNLEGVGQGLLRAVSRNGFFFCDVHDPDCQRADT